MPWDQDRLYVTDFVAMVDEMDSRNADAKKAAREAKARENRG
jgi:hypothetical protein